MPEPCRPQTTNLPGVDRKEIGAFWPPKYGDQFVINDLDNLLTRRYRTERLLPARLGFNIGDELLDYLEVNIGFQQCAPDFLEGVLDVLLSELAMTPESLKYTF